MGGGVQPTFPPDVGFSYWDSLSATTCRGYVGDFFSPAADVRLELWYAGALRESSKIVVVGNVPGGPGSFTPFYATPQTTNGEPRFPRAGLVTWRGGSNPSPYPRAPFFSPFGNWCWSAPDSLVWSVYNSGGWAYHVVVTLENRDGVRDFSPPLGRLGSAQTWYLYSPARDSSGVLVAPKVIGMRWEDYGGVPYSQVPQPLGILPTRCY